MSKATAEKIRKMSRDAAEKKIAERQTELEKTVNQDIKVIEKILEMVKDRLVYKESEKEYSRRKVYTIVTEETVLDDYSNPAKYSSGTSIKEVDASYYTYRHTAITVNGHRYYHAHDLIAKYQYDAQEAFKKSEAEYDAAKKRKETLESMEDLEPVMKELMLNHQKHLRKLEAKDGE